MNQNDDNGSPNDPRARPPRGACRRDPRVLLDRTGDPGLGAYTRLRLRQIEQEQILAGFADEGYLIDTREKLPPE